MAPVRYDEIFHNGTGLGVSVSVFDSRSGSEEGVSGSCRDYYVEPVAFRISSSGYGSLADVSGFYDVPGVGSRFSSGDDEFSGKDGDSVLENVYLEVSSDRKCGFRNAYVTESSGLGPCRVDGSGDCYTGSGVRFDYGSSSASRSSATTSFVFFAQLPKKGVEFCHMFLSVKIRSFVLR